MTDSARSGAIQCSKKAGYQTILAMNLDTPRIAQPALAAKRSAQLRVAKNIETIFMPATVKVSAPKTQAAGKVATPGRTSAVQPISR
jgi:hypothetical protein